MLLELGLLLVLLRISISYDITCYDGLWISVVHVNVVDGDVVDDSGAATANDVDAVADGGAGLVAAGYVVDDCRCCLLLFLH